MPDRRRGDVFGGPQQRGTPGRAIQLGQAGQDHALVEVISSARPAFCGLVAAADAAAVASPIIAGPTAITAMVARTAPARTDLRRPRRAGVTSKKARQKTTRSLSLQLGSFWRDLDKDRRLPEGTCPFCPRVALTTVKSPGSFPDKRGNPSGPITGSNRPIEYREYEHSAHYA
jgi:hypothetical protein